MLMNLRKVFWKFYAKYLRHFPNNRIKEYWEAAAKIYPLGTICTSGTKKNFESLFTITKHSSIKLTKDMVVLDVGCGIGRSTPYVAPQVSKYIGVDYSKNMIREAKKRHKHIVNAFFVQNDGQNFSGLESNSVDLAYCELVFQHMTKENTAAYISEVLRVLKPQGIFIAQIPRLDHFRTLDPDAEVYGMTKEETDQAFANYTFCQFLDFEFQHAYYLVRAIK